MVILGGRRREPPSHAQNRGRREGKGSEEGRPGAGQGCKGGKDRRKDRARGQADQAIAESEALKPVARLEDLHVWIMEKTKTTKKGS